MKIHKGNSAIATLYANCARLTNKQTRRVHDYYHVGLDDEEESRWYRTLARSCGTFHTFNSLWLEAARLEGNETIVSYLNHFNNL